MRCHNLYEEKSYGIEDDLGMEKRPDGRGVLPIFRTIGNVVKINTSPAAPFVSKNIYLSEEGDSKLERIVILTEGPQEDDGMISYLRSLFPECEIEILERSSALIGKGGQEAGTVATGKGEKIGHKP